MLKIQDILKFVRVVDKRVLAVKRMEKKMAAYRKMYAIKTTVQVSA